MANNISVKDASSNSQTVKTTDNSGVHTPHHNVDSSALPTGAATETTLAAVLTQTNFDTKTGALTETAPATDTASSGLNGRLQRIAQRLTSLIALLPTALTGSGNLKAALVESTATVTVAGSGTFTTHARTRTADAIATAVQTDAIMNGLTALTPKFAAIAAATSGSNTLVAAVTSKKIRVLALMGIAAGAVNIYFDDSGSTVIFGGSTNKINLAANFGFVLPFNPTGWFETGSGNGLRLNLSGATAFSGGLVYVEV